MKQLRRSVLKYAGERNIRPKETTAGANRKLWRSVQQEEPALSHFSTSACTHARTRQNPISKGKGKVSHIHEHITEGRVMQRMWLIF